MNPTNPTISVVMGVYNGAKYLPRSIFSLLGQDFSDFELIIVDDGSTDRTSKIINSIKDDRIVVINQENSGLTKSLNVGLNVAKGKWIARQDADDFSLFNRFSAQLNFLSKNPNIKLLGSSCFIQPEKHGIVNEIYSYPSSCEEIRSSFSYFNPFVHGSMVIERSLIEGSGGYNESYRYVQDYELWSRLVNEYQCFNIKKPLYCRTVHNDASELTVDKGPIFDEIRANYLKKYDISAVSPEVQIESISVYPVLGSFNRTNIDLSKTISVISSLSKKHTFPYVKDLIHSYIYSPFYKIL